MAVIALEGMEFFAYHGYYPEENVVGGNYVVDAYLGTNITRAAMTDELPDTVNYETAYLIVATEMRIPSKLLEQVAQRIVYGFKNQFPNLHSIKVRVRKLSPAMEGRVESSYVEEENSFISQCGRCKRPFVCYGDDTCWCKAAAVIHPKTLENLKHQFHGKCLCKDCLGFYAG